MHPPGLGKGCRSKFKKLNLLHVEGFDGGERNSVARTGGTGAPERGQPEFGWDNERQNRLEKVL